MPAPARSHRPKSPRSPHGLQRTTACRSHYRHARRFAMPVPAHPFEGRCVRVAGIAMDDIDGEEGPSGAFEEEPFAGHPGRMRSDYRQIVFAEDRRRMEMRMERNAAGESAAHHLARPAYTVDQHFGRRGHLCAIAARCRLSRRTNLYRGISRRRVLAGHARGGTCLSITRIDKRHAAAVRTAEAGGGCREEALQHVDRRAGRRRVDVELEDELLWPTWMRV